MQDDARFPWIVLIPRVAGAREWGDLSRADQGVLLDDLARAATAVHAVGAILDRPVAKLNIGALGNIVAQLHIHVVGRRGDDAAWPSPVWGFGQAAPYAPADLDRAVEAARRALAGAA